MTMKSKTGEIGFALRKIATEQFAAIEDGYNEQGEIGFNVSLRFSAEKKQRFVTIFALFTFTSDDKPFLVAEASCHFQIKDSAWKQMIRPETNELVVPKVFLSHLSMLTIGTCRGILHSKTEGTCFNKYIIPTINVTEIIKKDASFNLGR